MNGTSTRDTRTTLIRRNYSEFLSNQREKTMLEDLRVSKRDFTEYRNWRQKKRKEDDLLRLYVEIIDKPTFLVFTMKSTNFAPVIQDLERLLLLRRMRQLSNL